MYRFEHKISTTNAGQPGGRLAYAGLSGGFGSITLGQIWNAAYNHAGAITDKSYYFGNATTGYRHGSALSYAHSTGPVSFQLDLISDGGMDTGQGIDKTEFGVTVAMGEVGKIALAHTNMRDTMKIGIVEEAVTELRSPIVPAVPATEGTPDTYWVRRAATAEETAAGVTGNPGGMTEAKMITVTYAADDSTNVNTAGELLAAGLDAIRVADGVYRVDVAGSLCDADDAEAANACKTTTAFVSTKTTVARDAGDAADTTTTVHETFHLVGTAVGDVVKTPGTPGTDAVPQSGGEVTREAKDAVMGRVVDTPGHKNTHIAVEFNVGGMTPYVGHSTKKNNQAIKGVTKTKTTHYGVSGGLGDTGINFLVAARNVKPDVGAKTSPWLFNLSKNLGGGATVIFEHANYDSSGPGNKETAIGLHVSF